jgi:hypothetical protein
MTQIGDGNQRNACMSAAAAASYGRNNAKEACMAIRRPPDLPRSAESSAAKKRARPRTSPSRSALTTITPTSVDVSDDARRAMISAAAYLRAEQRGFSSGYELEDWLIAEREVDALLSAHQGDAPQ